MWRMTLSSTWIQSSTCWLPNRKMTKKQNPMVSSSIQTMNVLVSNKSRVSNHAFLRINWKALRNMWRAGNYRKWENAVKWRLYESFADKERKMPRHLTLRVMSSKLNDLLTVTIYFCLYFYVELIYTSIHSVRFV
jgi:fructose-1,6-bisphosphatase